MLDLIMLMASTSNKFLKWIKIFVPLYVPPIKTCLMFPYLIKSSHYTFFFKKKKKKKKNLFSQKKLINQKHHHHQPWLALATAALDVTGQGNHCRTWHHWSRQPTLPDLHHLWTSKQIPPPLSIPPTTITPPPKKLNKFGTTITQRLFANDIMNSVFY